MKLLSFISIELFIILFLPLTYIFHNSKISIFELDNKSPSNSEFLSIPKENKEINPTAANLKLNSYGALLWKGTAETGDLSEWSPNGGNHLMNPARVLFSNASKDRAKSGTNSYKLTVDAGTDMASTQLYRYGKSGQPNSNKDAIYTAWYFIPGKIDFYGVSWHNIMQWKVRTESTKSHPVFTIGLGVIGGKGSGGDNFLELRNTGEYFPGGSSFNYVPINRIPIPIGKWFKIEVRYIHGSDKNGKLMMWQGDVEGNDTLIYEVSNVTTYPTIDRNGSPVTEIQWSVNNYTARTIPAITTVFIDDASIHLPGSAAEKYSIKIESNPKEGGNVKISGN